MNCTHYILYRHVTFKTCQNAKNRDFQFNIKLRIISLKF